MNTPNQKFAFVALIGRPNAGKSTLLNQIVGQKISIVTHKVQTTRRRLLGVCTHEATQLAFIDTPGIFDHEGLGFEGQMVACARQGLRESDIICVLIDTLGRWEEAGGLLDEALATKKPVFLLLNKIDKIEKEKLLEITATLTKNRNIQEIFMVSALKGDGVDRFIAAAAKVAEEGPWHFEPDQLTDLPQRIWAAELTREVLFEEVHQELPYGLTVETEKWEQTKNGIKIHQMIVVEKASHKAMILGAKGVKVRSIGTAARYRLKREMGCEVHLFLHVKVNAKWKAGAGGLDALGLDAFPLKKTETAPDNDAR